MNYNINFQVAAVIITALLLYHFLYAEETA